MWRRKWWLITYMHKPWTDNSAVNVWGGGRTEVYVVNGGKIETSVKLSTIKINFLKSSKAKQRSSSLFKLGYIDWAIYIHSGFGTAWAKMTCQYFKIQP